MTTRPLLEISKLTEVQKYSLDEVVKSNLGDGKIHQDVVTAILREVWSIVGRLYLRRGLRSKKKRRTMRLKGRPVYR